jgi:predicted acyltransferase
MFVFVVGVSLVFSLNKQLETRGTGGAIRRVILRGAVLYILGLLYYGGLSHGVEHLRLMGVLQRIALAYLFAGLMFCLFRPRILVAVCIGLLIGYWALLVFVPVPGVGHASFAEGRNLANWIDAKYLPFFKWDGDHDPEGLLSTLPAIASCLLGVFAGLFLRANKPAPWIKAFVLIIFGAGLTALGYYWGNEWPGMRVPDPWRFPIIKKIWTSSFVLVAGGYSAALLGLFYLIMDVTRFRIWALPFVWIGMNAITLYLIEKFVRYDKLAEMFVGKWGNADQRLLVVNLIAVAIMFVLARFLYGRKVFIRV